MTTLFPVLLDADALRSPRLRVEPVRNEAMEPTLRLNDFVLCVPAHEYEGEGLYVLDVGSGHPKICRCEHMLVDGRIRISHDNKVYPVQFVSREDFDRAVLAIVVADVRVRDEPTLLAAIGKAGEA